MKWLTDSLKKMDKTKWMIVGLSGILLLVIALPTDSGRKKQELALQAKEPDTSRQAQVNAYQKQLANEMEQALGCMDGVGKVRVMITFQETDGREPYISQQKLPAVEGVLVVAQGGGDSKIKREISDAVMALFPIQAHKIKIVKMQEQ